MSELADLTRCTICGRPFSGPRISIIGQPARIQAYVAKLAEHVNVEHPKHAQALNLSGMAYIGMRYLMLFQTTDRELQQQRDFHRWQVHQQTLNVRIPDDKIRSQSAELAERFLALATTVDDPTSDKDSSAWKEKLLRNFASELANAITYLRNELEEPGKYTPAGNRGI